MEKQLGEGVPPDDQANSGFPRLRRPELVRVLQSAARLQEIVPDAVLVGGSAAALWADHRTSNDHDHVVADLAGRFEAILEAIEATDGWVTNRVMPGKIVLGALGDVESGVRQLIRSEPLEVTEVTLPSAGVATQIARQLADPRPADARTIKQLHHYKGLDARWANVTAVCRSVAAEMVQ